MRHLRERLIKLMKENNEFNATHKYHRNAFTKNLLDNVHKSQNDATKRGEGKSGENNWHTLTEKEKYIMHIFNAYTRLDHVIEQLNHIVIYLNRFSLNEKFEKNDINELTYLQYHLEVYFHKIHTVLELKKIIVNRVFKFDLKDKDCTWENLKKCKGFNGSVVEPVMDKFFKAFKPMIDRRHFNTHRGYFDDPEIDRFSTPLFIYAQSRKYNMDISDYKQVYPEFLVKYGVRDLRRKRAKEIATNNETLYLFINAFYTAINKTFNSRLKRFNEGDEVKKK